MSWRTIQLGSELCDQDRIILNLFKNKSVKYVGADKEFLQYLNLDTESKNLILILNQPMWISDLYNILHENLTTPVNQFYIGINRYMILGNDTDIIAKNSRGHGDNIIQVIDKIITKLNYTILNHGTRDNDLGRYFNFVQPLTWVYGTYATNKSH